MQVVREISNKKKPQHKSINLTQTLLDSSFSHFCDVYLSKCWQQKKKIRTLGKIWRQINVSRRADRSKRRGRSNSVHRVHIFLCIFRTFQRANRYFNTTEEVVAAKNFFPVKQIENVVFWTTHSTSPDCSVSFSLFFFCFISQKKSNKGHGLAFFLLFHLLLKIAVLLFPKPPWWIVQGKVQKQSKQFELLWWLMPLESESFWQNTLLTKL